MFRVPMRHLQLLRGWNKCSYRTACTMNRPRNRQPRQGRDGNNRTPRNQPRTSSSNVPNIQQVVPGASVSIVLKQDQPTGREVQGLVQDLLTRGDHPRGIKVRLKDGRIGRVQRMVTADQSASPAVIVTNAQPYAVQELREHEALAPEGPPPRTLGDYIPNLQSQTETLASSDEVTFSSATIKCPICGLFEGDEAAVSHHIEEHLD